MNVLFIQEFIYLQNTRVYRLAEQLKINGCNTYYATCRPYIDCRNKEAFNHGFMMLKGMELHDVINYIKAYKIDVVVFHNLNRYLIEENVYTEVIKYCKENEIKFIMSFGDMHSAFDNYFFDSEQFAYENADMVWCLSEIQKTKLIEFFGNRDNNPIIYGKIPNTWKSTTNISNYDPKNIEIAYIGRISGITKNRYILPVLKELIKNKIKIKLFLADEPKVELPKSEYVELKIDLEYKELIKQISSCDFGLVVYSMGEWNKYNDWLELCLPNKFFDYLHAKLPIINYYGQSMKNYIDKYNIGYSYISFDTLIRRLREVDESQHKTWRENITEDIFCFKKNEVKEVLEGLF